MLFVTIKELHKRVVAVDATSAAEAIQKALLGHARTVEESQYSLDLDPVNWEVRDEGGRLLVFAEEELEEKLYEG